MNLVKISVEQPITVAVGVILSVLAGVMAFYRVPIQMTPQVNSVVISATTFWENATAQEIESDVIEPQEERLGDLSGLVSMTSNCQAGRGSIRLEFKTGTDIKKALAEVDLKINQVPTYPEGVDKPVIEDIDPDSRDYIAWIGLASSDLDFDATTIYDFMERRLKPRFERIPGVSQVGIVGARESEVRIRVDPEQLALRGITYEELVSSLQVNNSNFSGGKVTEGKNDIRLRTIGRFANPEYVEKLVIKRVEGAPIYLADVADIELSYKEKTDWVRSRGQLMPFFNYQLELGANLLEVMDAIRVECDKLNAEGGLLEQYAKQRGMNGTLELVQCYDATTYVNDAFALVTSNIYTGGLLATITLLLFLRSVRTIGIIAIAIPISTMAAIAILVVMGRTMNIISLAGMAFAIGMVVDNAIVVIENIFRHLEMGKSSKQAAYDGTIEVGRAVLASTLTTLVVFLPILLIEEQAGQLFRDIALAIMAAVGISLIVSITVIPSAAGLLLRPKKVKPDSGVPKKSNSFLRFLSSITNLPNLIGQAVYLLIGNFFVKIAVVLTFVLVTVLGIYFLIVPIDYLPKGNRNIVFGLMFPPPGYSLDHLGEVGERVEDVIRPAWQNAGKRFKFEDKQPFHEEYQKIEVPSIHQPGKMVEVPPVDNYFIVSMDGVMFHGAISLDKEKTIDVQSLMYYATRPELLSSDMFAVAFQMPLFQTGGTSGQAIKINVIGDDLETINSSALALFGTLMGTVDENGQQQYQSISPKPSNFMLPATELQVVPDDERLRNIGMTRRDVGLATMAAGDGILLPRQFEQDGELKDIKIVNNEALLANPLEALRTLPIATPDQSIIDLQSIANVDYVRVPSEVVRVDRQRAVTLELSPGDKLPLDQVIQNVNKAVADLREAGAIPSTIEITMTGSAGALNDMKRALMGDGSILGTLSSSLFLALLIVYLLMVVLFQSWMYPTIIMVTVPLATLGGFMGLKIVNMISAADPYVPEQKLDVLTILGFVILAGVVVNNAILIVYQAINFMKGRSEEGDDVSNLTPREAIAESVRTRVRPILMSTLTSVGGMLPLVLMPGSGSELYRGLGAVVVGGLLVSTIFTMFLVPVLLSLLLTKEEPSESQAIQTQARENEMMPATVG